MNTSSMAWVREDTRPTKLQSLETALATLIEPGMALYLPSDARAALRGLIHQFAGTSPEFTLIALRVGGSHAVDLIQAGLVKHIIGSSFGVQFPSFRPSKTIQRVYSQGQIKFECWSLMALVQRLMAAAMGVPFMPTRSMVDSELVAFNSGTATIANPFGGDPTLVIEALYPDIAFVHALAADQYGNVLMPPPVEDDLWSTRAARRGVIVLAENIVSTDFLRSHSHVVRIPAYKTLAVCHTPYAAHPDGYDTGLDLGLPIQKYLRDTEHYKAYYEASLSADLYDAWLAKWCVDLPDWHAYLQTLGDQRLQSLAAANKSAAAPPSDWRSAYDSLPGPVDTPSNATEMMIAAAARTVAEVARLHDLQHCLVGAGTAELAGSVALYTIRRSHQAFDLVNGVGRFGYEPVPVPEYRQLTAIMLTNTVDTYGTIVGGPYSRCIALVGSGEVDVFGNINSTRSQGKFLVGSGGVNDAISGAAVSIILMRQDIKRLVEHVEFVTCPGTRTTHLVTDLGVFRKGDDGRFELYRYYPQDHDADRASVLARIQQRCGFAVRAADDLAAMPAPTEEERRLMAWLDPRRAVIGRD